MEELNKEFDEEIKELFKILKKCRDTKEFENYQVILQIINYLMNLKKINLDNFVEPEPEGLVYPANIIKFGKIKRGDK